MDIIYITIKTFIFIFIILIFWFDNPIYSILSLVCSFLFISILLLYFNVEFLAYMYILVYVGAVAIFFLFVVMLLNIDLNKKSLSPNFFIFYSILFIFYISKLISLSSLYQTHLFNAKPYLYSIEYNLNYAQSDYILFSELYVDYFYLFFITSLILVITMIGSIGVCLKHN